MKSSILAMVSWHPSILSPMELSALLPFNAHSMSTIKNTPMNPFSSVLV